MQFKYIYIYINVYIYNSIDWGKTVIEKEIHFGFFIV